MGHSIYSWHSHAQKFTLAVEEGGGRSIPKGFTDKRKNKRFIPLDPLEDFLGKKLCLPSQAPLQYHCFVQRVKRQRQRF
jgi:hypothetical protein